MKRIIVALLVLSFSLSACSKQPSDDTSLLDTLEQISFSELDKKLENKETITVYFGWIENCGDSLKFQKNYLEKKIAEVPSFSNIYIVNLDVELPDALMDHELREPMIEKYQVAGSPTMVHYVDGEIDNIIGWTTLNSSDATGILESELDTYFNEIGLLDSK